MKNAVSIVYNEGMKWIFIAAILLQLSVWPVHAIYDPLSVPNNRYGIHIADFADIPDISPLVNTSGGDWGYVTLVASDNDRDTGKWQIIFDQMREMHLIPIVRLATHVAGDTWVKPDQNRYQEIVDFLSHLNWPIQNRYVVLYNEPNHANEWGGSLDPEGYAQTLAAVSTLLKTASEDFFILPAGLDASAVSDGKSMDEEQFLERMLRAKPELLSLIDGWTSHAYPNPGFSGSVFARGRGTLTTFDWELRLLGRLGLTKPLPVFITETGWTHSEGAYRTGGNTPEEIARRVDIAARDVWQDSRVVAVTPFLFNYQAPPFDHFSWKKLGGNGFYAPYYMYQMVPKTHGQPKQLEVYTETHKLIPDVLIAGSSYTLTTEITNNGQGILNSEYHIKLAGSPSFTMSAWPLPTLRPRQKGTITIYLQTPQALGKQQISLGLIHGDRETPLESNDVTIIPPPSLRIHAQLGWKRTNEAKNVTVLLYDKKAALIQKFTGLTLHDGQVIVPGLGHIVPGGSYRIVTLVPYYLPRQTILPLSAKETDTRLARFFPLDTNNDGRWDIADFLLLLKTPPRNIMDRFVNF